MKTYRTVLFLIIALGAITGLRADPAHLEVEISANDAMKYTVTKIEAHPGQTITVHFKNAGTLPKEVMGHNWILLKLGVSIDSYGNAAGAAKAEGFEPKALADKVIASVPLLGAGQTADVTFTGPTEPGTYNYLCSFPGHALLGMKGVLIVK
jgi:azurin